MAGLPEAVEYLRRAQIDAVVVSLPLPEYTAGEALEELQRAESAVPLILLDPEAKLPDAVRLIKSGACDVLGPEAGLSCLGAAIREAIAERRSRIGLCPEAEPWRRILVGSSQPFEDVVGMVRLGRPAALHRAHHRRDRNRQGDGRAGHSPGGAAGEHAHGRD